MSYHGAFSPVSFLERCNEKTKNMNIYKICFSKESEIKGIKCVNNQISEIYVSVFSDNALPTIEKMDYPKHGDICCTLGNVKRIFVYGNNEFSIYYNNSSWELEKNFDSVGCRFRIASDEEKMLFKEILSKNNISLDEKTNRFIDNTKWRANLGGEYFFIGENFVIQRCFDFRHEYDNIKFECGNYFRTIEEAQKVLNRLLENIQGND